MGAKHERVRELRLYMHLSQEEFANRLQINKDLLANVEAGTKKLSDDLFITICRHTNVNPVWLALGKGSMLRYRK